MMRGGLTVVLVVGALLVATNKEDDLGDLTLVRPAGAGPKAATEKPGKAAGAAARARANAEIFIVVVWDKRSVLLFSNFLKL